MLVHFMLVHSFSTYRLLVLFGCFFILFPFVGISQEKESLYKPLISAEKMEFLDNIYMSMNMRMGFRSYIFRGGDHDYQGNQFVNEYTAVNIRAKVHEKGRIDFRKSVNETANIINLDL